MKTYVGVVESYFWGPDFPVIWIYEVGEQACGFYLLFIQNTSGFLGGKEGSEVCEPW